MRKRRASRGGFALVTTLLIMAMLAIVIVAFCSSIASERQTAHAFTNATRAELAAQAALGQSIGMLKGAFQAHPDSATTWEEVLDPLDPNGAAVTQATVFYYRDHPNSKKSFEPGDACFLQPLISGAVARPVGARGSTLALAEPGKPYGDSDNSVDLNRARFPGDNAGWIGSPPGGPHASFTVPWVEMTDPTDPAKVTARYAFWVEDESFKVNANLTGTNARGSGSAGDSPAQIPLQGLLQAVNPASGTADADAAATAIFNLRKQLANEAFPEFRALNRAQTAAGSSLGDDAKFEGTIFSGALNLSRSGAKRLNVNAVIRNSIDPVAIRKQLDELIGAIHLQLPNFGQRFYRLDPGNLNDAQVTPAHAEIYLQKIACNLRDYISTDTQPTIVNNDAGRTIRIGSKPTGPIEPLPGASWPGVKWGAFKGGDNSVLAIGKKNLPYLQEFACRVTLKDFNPAASKKPDQTGAHYDFYFDYYFEFWNMTARDIKWSDLGPSPFLKICNQAAWLTSGTSSTSGIGTAIPEGRDFEIKLPPAGVPLDAVAFPAGRATVLTTDMAPPKILVSDSTHVVNLRVPATAHHYTGTTYLSTTETDQVPSLPGQRGFRVNLQARSSQGATGANGASDYETGMLLGNANGIIESFCALPISHTGDDASKNALSINNDLAGSDNDAISGKNHAAYFIRGGSLRGSPAPSQYGDPRTNNEQLFLRIYDSGGDADQTRYYSSALEDGTANVPATSTLGAPDSNYVNHDKATAWPDAFQWNPTGVDAPMVIAGGPMKSIGELGNLFDPARGVGPSGDIRYSRGGGRTLNIGQPDPLWDKDPQSASREWAAWRLADLFCTTDETELEGRLNLNGVRRDGGAALKAALSGYRFSTGADAEPQLASRALAPAAMDALVQQIVDRLDRTGLPFAERGELSELPIFQQGTDLAGAGVDMAGVYDRGREELFRRLVELVATRGNVFSVYALGQSIAQTPAGKKVVTASSRIKVTFELLPVWADPQPGATFDPTDPAATQARFRPPDSYRVKILQVSS